MQETVLIEETMQHASIDFLFLSLLRIFKALHCFDKFFNFLVDLMSVS